MMPGMPLAGVPGDVKAPWRGVRARSVSGSRGPSAGGNPSPELKALLGRDDSAEQHKKWLVAAKKQVHAQASQQWQLKQQMLAQAPMGMPAGMMHPGMMHPGMMHPGMMQGQMHPGLAWQQAKEMGPTSGNSISSGPVSAPSANHMVCPSLFYYEGGG